MHIPRAWLVRTSGAALAASFLVSSGCVVVVHDHDEWGDGDHAQIGVCLEPVERETATQLQVDRDHACTITYVRGGGPADKAGVRRYDIITHVDGEADASVSRVRSAIRAKESGEIVKLTVLREGKPIDLEMPVED
jgi:serine protease Do